MNFHSIRPYFLFAPAGRRGVEAKEKNRKMRFLILLSIFFFIAPAALAQTFSGKLVKVVDGDTVHVLKNGKAEKIRLADIDCPEQKQPFGQVAKRFVLDLAAQKIVTVDVKTTDRYGPMTG